MNDQIQVELQNRIEAFANDVTTILQKAVADAVAAGLSSNGLSKAVRDSSGGRAQIDEATLLREVKRSPGQRMEQLAKALGTSTKALGKPMGTLIQEKKVKKKGQARGTTYRAA